MALAGKLALSAFPGVLALFGVWMLRRTHQGRAQAAAVDGTATTPVGDLQPGDGVVEVQGVARATTDETLPATMLDTEGVVVRTVVEQRAADEIGSKRKTDWDTVYADGEYVPFAIDDGTGEIAVEPPDGDVSKFTVDSTLFESEPGAEPPEPVRRWLAEADGIDAAVDQYRGYRQAVIEDGETVTGIGEPVAGDGGLVLTGDQRPDEFVVSDLSKDELVDETAAGLGGYVVGALLFLVGAVPLALLWL